MPRHSTNSRPVVLLNRPGSSSHFSSSGSVLNTTRQKRRLAKKPEASFGFCRAFWKKLHESGPARSP